MNPDFAVPPEYFYALGASLPPEITPEQRYELATGMSEQQVRAALQKAEAARVIDVPVVISPGMPPITLNVAQAARRLQALGTLGALPSRRDVPPAPHPQPGTPLFQLVQDWLAYQPDDVDVFWTGATPPPPNPPSPLGHLELALTAITDGSGPLIDAIIAIPVGDINELIGLSAGDWRAFFDRRPGLLPEFTQPGTTAERTSAFLRRLRRYWSGNLGQARATNFALVLDALTDGDPALIAAIQPPPPPTPPWPVTTIPQLENVTPQQWRALFESNPALLPAYTEPGGVAEQIAAFLRRLRTYLPAAAGGGAAAASTPPTFGLVVADPLDAFIAAYEAAAGAPFTFGGAWDLAAIVAGLDATFGADQDARDWMRAALNAINELFITTATGAAPLRFSLMETLYARGFTSRAQIAALSAAEFQQALVGTVAYDHAAAIRALAGGAGPRQPVPTPFSPVNPDGTLVDCIPPPQLSPFSPTVYLQQLLQASPDSTCEVPLPSEPQGGTFGQRVDTRRGALGGLPVTRTNLATPLPLIDLVNESLEYLAANPGQAHGIVYDTGEQTLAGHALGPDGHAPETLFEALPEHSSPATPVAEPDAYIFLAGDFSVPLLPYTQPLEISRAYLRRLGTTRYALMRHYRRAIHEFVLTPGSPPAGFDEHLWRYPVSLDIAREYLRVSEQEHLYLFTRNIATSPGFARLLLWQVYGFTAEEVDGRPWTDIVATVSEFLARTGLTYCQLVELRRSQFIQFQLAGDTPDLPECEPCCLDQLTLLFENPVDALRALAVFIRLWRRLQGEVTQRYTFEQLRDICQVLQLFRADGSINPDFLRQLAAFQMLRDMFALPLADEHDPGTPGTGADRMHLLALWAAPPARTWAWAVGRLLEQIQTYAEARHGRRPPEFLKLLADNLDILSRLAGFNPTDAAATWHAHPTHTLRFAEALSKLYGSRFTVGEILFFCTAGDHLRGDDPFPLASVNETLDSPLDLPDDEPHFSLWQLRHKLLGTSADQHALRFTWTQIDATLRQDYGYNPPAGGADPLLSLARHLFPGILEAEGIPVPAQDRQYRVGLAATSAPLWNTGPGPFRYDMAAQELWCAVPVADADALGKLARIRPLDPAERDAVSDLYFAPRADLAEVGFLFSDLAEADRHLIQEADEKARWEWFRERFALFHARSKVIADHLAAHVAAATHQPAQLQLARRILRSLFGDENLGTGPWEANSGAPPNVTWSPYPNGGALAALLGLTGTGLVGTFTTGGQTVWREMHGPLNAFGTVRNDANAPVPTIIPSMNATLTADQQRFAGIRNGFALANRDGQPLGGAEAFTVRWEGVLLVEREGEHTFYAGAPTPPGTPPDTQTSDPARWRVRLSRGQRTWTLLARRWPGEDLSAAATTPLLLRRGVYHLTVEVERPRFTFDGPEDVRPQRTGFELKYSGPDTDDELIPVPFDRLFAERKDDRLGARLAGAAARGQAARFLRTRYVSSLRDIRRTYQRAFKALLFAARMGLSAAPVSDDEQSEIGYMLAHPDRFAGVAYPRVGGVFTSHRVYFDFNLLPVGDTYLPPTVAADGRGQPTQQRQTALFDLWERTFDSTALQRQAQRAPEHPAWLLFHESAELQPDEPAQLLRHLGIDLTHAPVVLSFYNGYQVSSADLQDERWAIRVWESERWLRRVLRRFLARGDSPVGARPDLWAGDDPSVPAAAGQPAGNDDLTRFVREGLIENGEPRRYADLKEINDGLREAARNALVAYLCRMDRVPLPWGGHARRPDDLSDLLLIDVEAGLCQKASRVEEGVTAVQTLIRRARLGLEPGLPLGVHFDPVWRRRFIDYRTWEACRRQEVYRENVIEWEELQQARQGEAFRFLEDQLRRVTLTLPVPGGSEYWTGLRPPAHPGLTVLQTRDPSIIALLPEPVEGLGLMGTPQRDARPSWLAPAYPLGLPAPNGAELVDGAGDDGEDGILEGAGIEEGPGDENDDGDGAGEGQPITAADIPFWMEAAIRLGVRFLRIAAASEPQASALFEPRMLTALSCCTECGRVHAPLVDEYYFWLLDTRRYPEIDQDADAGGAAGATVWHDPLRLPGALRWEPEPTVHLVWCRVHNGEFLQVRRSSEGLRLIEDANPELVFVGRAGDSLQFRVTDATAPLGYPAPAPPPPAPQPPPAPLPGFRYDIATDEAFVLPLLVTPPSPAPSVGGLLAYPYFAFHAPGAPLMPTSLFSPAVAVADALRAHCRFEEALNWYELVHDPLHDDNAWVRCPLDGEDDDEEARLTSGCCDSGDAPPTLARRRAIVLRYLDTLLNLTDATMRRNTPEAFQAARVYAETAARIAGPAPHTVLEPDPPGPAPTIELFTPSFPPLNPRLTTLYGRIEDRLAQIRACLNARRLANGRPNRDMPYWGNSSLHDGWQSAADACADDTDCCRPHSPYRFLFLAQQAGQLVNDVRAMGRDLLAAIQSGDAEALASVRAVHERQLLELNTIIRQQQWREADWQRQALDKTREGARTRRRYYATLLRDELAAGEVLHGSLVDQAIGFQDAGRVLEFISAAVSWIPDMHTGAVGVFPTSINQLPLGTKLAGVFSTGARVSDSLAGSANVRGGFGLTEAGWDRREGEWRHQVEVIDVELEQIERQMLAAERRRDITERELTVHQRQIEHTGEVEAFLRDKFTNHALYLWLHRETAALHFQLYELALHACRQAQRAFNYERGHTAQRFLPENAWDTLHEGLLAGDRLQLALRRMEKAYHDENVREYELTKHISLRVQFPLELLELKRTGSCEITLPEWLFDLDYPGHYMRRIKNISVSIPAVTGPYTGVHCRVTQLSSQTRVDPRLLDPAGRCCDDAEHDGYEPLPDDWRIVKQYASVEAIATSTGLDDDGKFQMNFLDDRYQQFEFTGAICRLRVELPHENNHYDVSSVTDVIIRLNYAAREGGDRLRQVANASAQRRRRRQNTRFIDCRHELTDAWYQFDRPSDAAGRSRSLPLHFERRLFPFAPPGDDLVVQRLELFLETTPSDPGTHRAIEWHPALLPQTGQDVQPDVDTITCVASLGWPGLLRGSYELDSRLNTHIPPRGALDLGTLVDPAGSGIDNIFLFVHYEALVCGYGPDGHANEPRRPSRTP